MSEERMPQAGDETAEETAEQYDAHINARETHERAQKVEALAKENLSGKDLKNAGEIILAYRSGEITPSTVAAFAALLEAASQNPQVQTVLTELYRLDVRWAEFSLRMQQVAKTERAAYKENPEANDAKLITLIDKKYDGLLNAAKRSVERAIDSQAYNPVVMAVRAGLMPLRIARFAYRETRALAGETPLVAAMNAEDLNLEELIYALLSGMIPAGDAVIQHAVSKLPSENAFRKAIQQGLDLGGMVYAPAAVMGAAGKMATTAETAKVSALLRIRAERMAELNNEKVVIELAADYEDAEMHAADLPTDSEAANNKAA